MGGGGGGGMGEETGVRESTIASTRNAVLAGDGAGRESGEERVGEVIAGPEEVRIGGGGARGAPLEGWGVGDSIGSKTSIGGGVAAVLLIGESTRMVLRSVAFDRAIKVWKLAGRGGTCDGSRWGPVTWAWSRCEVSSMLAWMGSIMVCRRGLHG